MSATQFRVEAEGESTVVIVAGEIDLAARDEFAAVLAALTGHLILDLSAVTFLDSTGIGVITSTRKRLVENAGDLRLRAPHDVPRRALEVVGLGDWIDD